MYSDEIDLSSALSITVTKTLGRSGTINHPGLLFVGDFCAQCLYHIYKQRIICDLDALLERHPLSEVRSTQIDVGTLKVLCILDQYNRAVICHQSFTVIFRTLLNMKRGIITGCV